MSNPVVVPYDGSEFSKRAFPLALEIARRAGAALHIVRVHLLSVPSLEPQIAPPFEPDFLTKLVAYERDDLGKIKQQLEGQGVPIVTALLTAGLVVPLLRDYIAAQAARCVVLTTHGRGGFNRLWLGSVATGLVRVSVAPVILIPILDNGAAVTPEPVIHHVIVPLDGSTPAEQVLPHALEVARLFSARLSLLEIVPAVRVTQGVHAFAEVTGSSALTAAEHLAADAYLHAVADRLRAQGHDVQVEVREDWQGTGQAIVAVADELKADLIAISTHGRGAWSRFVIGSVADKVIRSARARVLTWHAPESARADPVA